MHVPPKRLLPFLLLLCGLLLASAYSHAQLKADFTADSTSGCSPLTLAFTNTTTGASPSVKYTWELGNGAISEEANPKAVYTRPGQVTVKLTASDGGQSSTKTLNITVYKNPVPDFTADPLKGCVPTEVALTSRSEPGDGTLVNYFWDFGDGVTRQGAGLHTTTHRYESPASPPVKLTVTNSHGCFATKELKGLLTMLPPIRIRVIADKTTLCALPAAVNFTTSTTGPGTLSYAWDFGNGTTSDQQTPPPVTYTEKGLYPVKLTVTSSEGCSQVWEQKDFINAANFNTSFDLPAPLCSNTPLQFESNSKPQPAQSKWRFGDNSEATGGSASHSYSKPGTYTVQLINTYGTCSDTAARLLTLHPAPALEGFVLDKTASCNPPLKVGFEDTARDATQRLWNFGTGNANDTATEATTSFTYTQPGSYTAALTITNDKGCKTTARKTISIQRPNIGIGIKHSTGSIPEAGCPGMTVQFTANPKEDIKSYRWDFGDGGTATVAEPTHSFNQEGFHTVKLYFTTTSGCEDSVVRTDFIRVYKKPLADFTSLSGFDICGNTPVRFQDLSDVATYWEWDFGDGGKAWGVQNPVYAYSRAGAFTVTLIATNQHCSDTATKPQLIKLAPPFPDITGFQRNCAERGKITFSQTTQGAVKWVWDFGDGSPQETYTTNKPEVTHRYQRSGVYRAVLYATNDTCTTLDTIHVSVMLQQQPALSLNKDVLCGSDTLSFTVSGMDTLRYYDFNTRQPQPYPYSGRIVYGDGTLHSYTTGLWYPPQYNQQLTTFRPGNDSIRIITYDAIHGCYDTSNFVAVKISGPVAGFRFTHKTYCFDEPIRFVDTSRGTNNVPIKQWIWDFGDGNTDTLTSGAPFDYRYASSGQFFSRLKVVDENGCYAAAAGGGQWATIYGPVAGFYTNDTLVAPNTPVQFVNTTNSWPYATTYTWDFGDGSARVAEVNPAHTYTRSGLYTVTLIARNNAGCSDTMVRKAYVDVKTVRAAFTFTASYVNGNNCPPLEARFISNATNADSLFWSFGNGGTSVNRNNPQATYYEPGVYTVILYAYGQGAVDSVSQEITVNGPYGTVTPSALMGCTPTIITLSGKVTNASRITWDFNDGYVAQGADTAATHTYTRPGVYFPKIILRDTAGCTSTILLEDSIIIDRLQQRITRQPAILCDSAWVGFNPNLESFAADSLKTPLSVRWRFGTNRGADTSAVQQPTFNYNRLGTYVVELRSASPYGCIQTATDTIVVLPKPKAGINALAGICVEQPILLRDTANTNFGESRHWSFGDGRTATADLPDTLTYSQPGTYDIGLVKTSTNGCSDTAQHRLQVDQLAATILLDKQLLCDTGTVSFSPAIQSYSRDQWEATLQYRWHLGPASGDSTHTAAARFAYKMPGLYPVSLRVSSPYGCVVTVSDSVSVLKTPSAGIQGLREICAGESVQFSGQVSEGNSTTWRWDMAGVGSDQQQPPPQTYNTAGDYPISLVAFNHPACPDTTTTMLSVHPLPNIGLAPKDTLICRGDTITLRANDAERYTWTLNNQTPVGQAAHLAVAPPTDARFTVDAINQFGCRSEDSMTVKVSQPFSITASADRSTICANWTTNLSVSGATRYAWIPADVSNPQSPAPVASPDTTTTYTVVGYGTDQCFTDTARLRIEVIPLPQLRVSNDTIVLWNTPVPLHANTSPDVTALLWTPAAYLNCTNCNDPVSTPQKPTEYRVIAKNSFGCMAMDTVRIDLTCSESTVHIPNAFTPDGDGLNDVFYPLGGGIRTIRYLRIFNRWGDLVFEKTNFNIADRNSGWNGTFDGQPLPPENYVYITEMVCATGQVIQKKGMVSLIR